MAKHSVLVARCRSAALLLDTMKLSRQRDQEVTRRGIGHTGAPAMPPEWYTKYWDLFEEVTQHAAMIYPQMLRTSMSSDTLGLCFKVSIIVALTAQLELLRMSAGFHPESRQKATDVALEVLGVTYGLRDEDFAQLEPILGVSSINPRFYLVTLTLLTQGVFFDAGHRAPPEPRLVRRGIRSKAATGVRAPDQFHHQAWCVRSVHR